MDAWFVLLLSSWTTVVSHVIDIQITYLASIINAAWSLASTSETGCINIRTGPCVHCNHVVVVVVMCTGGGSGNAAPEAEQA
jgi:hypothetical protein